MKVGPLETAAAELRAGRHGSAERKLKKHLKSRPRDPIARHLLGLAHLARGEPGPAVRQFRRTEAVTFNSSVLPLADDEVYAYILFMVFPVYNTIETLDPNQIEAAKDLGASTLRTHLRVVLPHAKPGIAVGSIMTFMLAAGSIAVPGLVGPGLHPEWFSQVIYRNFFEAGNWNSGSAYSLALLAACTLFIWWSMFVFRVGIRDIAIEPPGLLELPVRPGVSALSRPGRRPHNSAQVEHL